MLLGDAEKANLCEYLGLAGLARRELRRDQ